MLTSIQSASYGQCNIVGIEGKMPTKQKEIRAELTHLLWTVAKGERDIAIDDEVSKFIDYLHSAGCVLWDSDLDCRVPLIEGK